MENDDIQVAQPPATDKPKPELNLCQRMLGIFTSPSKVYTDVAKSYSTPDWLVPIIIMMVISLAAVWYMTSYGDFQGMMDQLMTEQAEKMNLDAETTAKMKEQASSTGSMMTRYIGAFVVPPGWMVLQALIFLLLGSMAFGGDAKFSLIATVVALGGLIQALASVVKTALIVTSGSFYVTTSLASLLQTDDPTSLPYQILARIDIFNLWTLWVFVIGISIIYKFTKSKAAYIVFGSWAVVSIVAIAMSMIQQMLMGKVAG